MKHLIAVIVLSFCCCMLCINCAAEKAPGGGPPDTVPPVLMGSSIKSGSTEIDSLLTLEFEFSEPLSAPSVLSAIRIFPLGRHDTNIRVRGRRITISPLKPWEDDLVYTVILGKNISDLRNNQMTTALQFSFTRGDKMPRNIIKGKVHGLKPGTTATIHISRNTAHPDSVLAAPEYLTQSDPEGNFLFEYLPSDVFHIAGYLDLNKSNTYNPLSDGVCVPDRPEIVPDTLETGTLNMLAVYDNFSMPRLLRARNVYPGETQLEFTKDPAPWNAREIFTVGGAVVDTIIYDQKTCVLYHSIVNGDSLRISIKGLKDYLSCTMKDTSFRIPLNTLNDTLYTFDQRQQTLFVTPPPAATRLRGTLKSKTDTIEIELKQRTHGLYALPFAPTVVRGEWHIMMPRNEAFPGIFVDSVYIVPLSLSAPPEFSAVSGFLETPVPPDSRIILESPGKRYETACDANTFIFPEVTAGTYTLLWYRDRNRNKRPDPGRPFPYERPEITYLLEKGIQVRSRWDVDLAEPYKIPVENEE